MPELVYEDFGLIDYKKAWDYQKEIFQNTISIKLNNRELPISERILTENRILLCEHPNVITLGKSGDIQNLTISESMLKSRGIDYYKIDRGGDITCHEPGQVVGYPILDLDQFFTDIDRYLRLLEEAIILTLKEFGINSGRLKGATGVWLDADSPKSARKICALGIKCSRWVTMHGFALNVNNDLALFDLVVPCGIKDKKVTSMKLELGQEVDRNIVKDKLRFHLSKLLNASMATH